MPNRNLVLRSAGYCLSAAFLLTAAASSSAWADPRDPVNPFTKRFLSGKPLDICDQGALFVGGVPKIPDFGEPRQLIIGHSYVQFQIPTKRRQWPIIMIHGGGYTGSALDATPDGREGWLAYSVRNNLATFVMDQPGRGRSGFDSSVINKARLTGDLSLLPPLGEPTSAIWTSWFGHIIPGGSNIVTGTMIRHGDPGDPDPAETDPPGPGHGVYPPKYPIPPVDNSIDANIEARLGAIGPAPNPANNTYLALNTFKFTVPSMEVTLPGSVCDSCTPSALAPSNTWSPLAMAELVERLGGAILAPHSQSAPQVLHAVRILRERGNLHLVKGIIIPEGGTDFVATGTTPQDYDTIPFLIVNGDYRLDTFRPGNRAFIAALNASPTRSVGPATYIDLDDPALGGKFLGTTHMNMLGTNNLELFDLFLDWAEDNIDNPIVQSSCPSGPPSHAGPPQGVPPGPPNGVPPGPPAGKGKNS